MSEEPDFVEEYRKQLPSVTPSPAGDFREHVKQVLSAAGDSDVMATRLANEIIDGWHVPTGELLATTALTAEQEIRRDALQMATGLLAAAIPDISAEYNTDDLARLGLQYAKQFADFITSG